MQASKNFLSLTDSEDDRKSVTTNSYEKSDTDSFTDSGSETEVEEDAKVITSESDEDWATNALANKNNENRAKTPVDYQSPDTESDQPVITRTIKMKIVSKKEMKQSKKFLSLDSATEEDSSWTDNESSIDEPPNSELNKINSPLQTDSSDSSVKIKVASPSNSTASLHSNSTIEPTEEIEIETKKEVNKTEPKTTSKFLTGNA